MGAGGDDGYWGADVEAAAGEGDREECAGEGRGEEEEEVSDYLFVFSGGPVGGGTFLGRFGAS